MRYRVTTHDILYTYKCICMKRQMIFSQNYNDIENRLSSVFIFQLFYRCFPFIYQLYFPIPKFSIF